MKTTQIILACILALLVCILIEFNLGPKTDLEIYTQDDIYYINGLEVTTEATGEVIFFGCNQELKHFIADLTANNVN